MVADTLKNLQYRHSSMAIQIAYEADRSILENIRTHSKELRSAHLNINPSLSRGTERIVLQSLTGGTIVNISPFNATLQTNYYDDFARDSGHEKRKEYAIHKLNTLLDYLTAANARFSFFGLFSVARITLTDNNISKEELIDAAAKYLGLTSSLNDFSPPFDFSIRVSKIDDNCFSNLSISWFEERAANYPVTLSGMPNPTTIQIKEWEMEVINQGIEVRWDYNNKYALFSGKHEWNKAQYLIILEKMFSTMPFALDRVRIGIEKFSAGKIDIPAGAKQ